MIETNSSLRLFSIFDSSPFTATPLISAVLGMNRAMEVHVWSGDHKRDRSSKIVEFLPESNTLRIYQIDISGSCRVAAALGMNTTVRSLDMTGAKVNSRWAKEFRWVLEQNKTLREVKLSKTGLKDKAVVYVAAGLFKNKSLQSLYVDGNRFGSLGVEDLLCPLSRFSALQLQANITLRSIVFGSSKTKIGRDGLTAVLKMVTTNETVVHLGIHDDASLGPDDFVHIFKSLQKNSSLRRFSLQGCKGVRGDRVLEAITETLQINPLIEEIDLARTPLQDSGKADEIYQKLGHNGRKIDEAETDDSLKDMPLTEPKSIRAFLCGQDYAGKTTLCNSILQSSSSSGFPYVENVRTLMNPVEQAVSGMQIKTFKDEETKISMWNLAGQHEFVALHDFMFPNPSLFLIILSLFRKPSNKEPKTPAEVEEELQYWLRFVVSNSRKAVQQCMKPNVTIVLTHSDKINQQSETFQTTVGCIQRLRDKFQALVDFYPTVFTVDARSSPSVSRLTHHIRMTSKAILQRVPRVYQLCNDMVQLLSDWRSENSNKPIMRWKAFADLCQFKVPSQLKMGVGITEFLTNQLAAEHPQVIPISVFIVILCLCLVIGHLLEENRWVNESITAILVGAVSGTVILLISKGKSSHILVFDEELFFIYLLPPIIFNAGFQVKKKKFFHNFLTIMSFGVIGVFISTVIISCGTWWLFPKLGFKGLSARDYLAIGTIFLSTDTVCTLQILHQDETPLLYSLVFGEGVVNDATSVVLFNAVQKIHFESLNGWTALQVFGNFLYLFSTSTVLGIAVGLITAFVLKTLYFGRHSTTRGLAIMVLMAYLSYMLAELFSLSGILTVFFCGVLISHYASYNVTESSRITSRHVFAMLSFIAETFIFLYVGTDALDLTKWKTSSLSVGGTLGVSSVITALVLLGRAAFVFPLSVLTNFMNRHTERNESITSKHQVIIWWAGLMRGAVSIALAFKQFTYSGVTLDPVNAAMVTNTTIVVLFTTLVFGFLTKPLVNYLLPHDASHNNTGNRGKRTEPGSPKEDATLPLLSFDESASTNFNRAKDSISLLMEQPVYTIHRYWRKFDDKYMRPIFGGPRRENQPEC